MATKKEIQKSGDIKMLVDAFYAKVRQDELLFPVFNEIIKDNWPQHLEKMYKFWESLLLEKVTYHGNPFSHHVNLPIGETHFERWLELFKQTIDELFVGERAEEAKMRADKIAVIFQSKLVNKPK
jgi:hemoglobin